MLQLNDPPEQARTAVLSLVANIADAVRAKAGRLSQCSKKSSTALRERLPDAIGEEMGILDSINEEKMVEGERWSISCAVVHRKAESWEALLFEWNNAST